jgi:hypothetical protein
MRLKGSLEMGGGPCGPWLWVAVIGVGVRGVRSKDDGGGEGFDFLPRLMAYFSTWET